MSLGNEKGKGKEKEKEKEKDKRAARFYTKEDEVLKKEEDVTSGWHAFNNETIKK